MIKVGPEDQDEIEKIVSLIPQIEHKGQTAPVNSPIDPTKLIPGKWVLFIITNIIFYNSN